MAQTSSKRPLTKHGSSTYFLSTSSIGVLIALTKQGNAKLKRRSRFPQSGRIFGRLYACMSGLIQIG